LIFHVMGALAEFERALIAERTRAGLASARELGVKVGRKPKWTREQIAHVRTLLSAGERPNEVAHSFGVSRATMYRRIAST